MTERKDPTQDQSGRTSRAERDQRRRRVAEMLISGVSITQVAQIIAGEYGVTPRMIRKDAERIFRIWEIEDRDNLVRQGAIFFRRINRLAIKAEAAEQFGVAAQLEALRLRALEHYLSGLGASSAEGERLGEHRTLADAARAAEHVREKRKQLRISVREAE